MTDAESEYKYSYVERHLGRHIPCGKCGRGYYSHKNGKCGGEPITVWGVMRL